MTKRTYVELGLSLQIVGIRWNNHSKMLLLKDTLTNNRIYSLFVIAMWTHSLLGVPQKFHAFQFDQQKSSVDQPTFGGDTSMCKLSASTTGWWCNNHVEKYEFVNGKDDIPSILWKIKHV